MRRLLHTFAKRPQAARFTAKQGELATRRERETKTRVAQGLPRHRDTFVTMHWYEKHRVRAMRRTRSRLQPNNLKKRATE